MEHPVYVATNNPKVAELGARVGATVIVIESDQEKSFKEINSPCATRRGVNLGNIDPQSLLKMRSPPRLFQPRAAAMPGVSPPAAVPGGAPAPFPGAAPARVASPIETTENPTRYHVSYREYLQLARDLAPKVDLFAAIWAKNPDARFMGGTSRDFLYWIRRELSKAKDRDDALAIMARLRKRAHIEAQEFIAFDSDVDVVSHRLDGIDAADYHVKKLDYINDAAQTMVATIPKEALARAARLPEVGAFIQDVVLPIVVGEKLRALAARGKGAATDAGRGLRDMVAHGFTGFVVTVHGEGGDTTRAERGEFLEVSGMGGPPLRDAVHLSLADALVLTRPDVQLPDDTFDRLAEWKGEFHDRVKGSLFPGFITYLPTRHGGCRDRFQGLGD